MKRFFLLVSMTLMSGILTAQIELRVYESSIRGLYFHPVSARAEAMGQAGVAGAASIQEIHLNPAGLGAMKDKLQTGFSYVKPIGHEKRSHIDYAGIGYHLNDKWSLGFSRLHFLSIYPDHIPSTATEGDAIDVAESYLTATAAYTIKEGLRAGINGTYFNHLYGDNRYFRSFMLGLGLQYEMPVSWIKHASFRNQRLQTGISLDNATFIDIKWQFDNSANIFPLISQLRLGGAYTSDLPASWLEFANAIAGDNKEKVDLLFQVQYLNFLNKDNNAGYGKWGYNIGAEVWLAQLLALRIGYLYEKREGDKERFNVSRVLSLPYKRGLTFGFGLNIPIHHLSNHKLPFDLAFDFIHRQAYAHIKENPVRKDPPFTNFGLRLDWKLN